MFDRVAARYDLANDVLSLGQDRAWRQQVVEAVEPQAGQLILDLAAGTGTSSEPFRRSGASVIPTDLSFGMLLVGKQRRPDLSFVAADALQLPYADGSFDAVTKNLHAITGHTPMLPKWAFGYAQSKERYVDARELVDLP